MRKVMLAVAAAGLGALAVVLPAVAGSETSPEINAVNSTGPYAEQVHLWSPPSVSVGEGGSVMLSNPTMVSHGVRWTGGPATPACNGVPVGTTPGASGTNWSGSCTFTLPGTYTFNCTVHGAAMSGTITVTAPGGEAPPSSPRTPTATVPPNPPLSGGQGPSGGGEGSAAPGLNAGAGVTPFAGGAGALKLAAGQRGGWVRGAVSVSPAGAGGALEVDLLAKAASLARGGAGRELSVGKLERSAPGAGTVHFKVPLNARGMRALRQKGRLALTVEVTLTPHGGRAARLKRSVVLRPRALR